MDVLRKYSAGKRNFSGANLYEANLYGANLSGADLSGADLHGVNLYGANLYKVDLYRANLYGANLSGANLYKADLSGADLSGADLHGAELWGADLYEANLHGANLSGANLPVSSHDAIAEILRREAGTNFQHRCTAGSVLASRDWCWEDFAREMKSIPDEWEWALSVLEQWDCFQVAVAKARDLATGIRTSV